MGFSEYLFITMFFGLPGIAGAWLARGREKNPLVWGLLSAFFPFVLLVLWFQKPDHQVPGYFRKCQDCGAVYPWKRSTCRYCGSVHQAAGGGAT